MTAWLASLIAAIAAALIKILGDDISKYIGIQKSQDAAAADAKASVQPLIAAKTGDEIDKAADSALNNL